MGKQEKSASAAGDVSVGRKKSWQTVVVLAIAAKEGLGNLTHGQYQHIKDQVKQLVGFGRRDFEANLDVRSFGDFWELRDKGGTLGRKNIRVYFHFDSQDNKVIVLHTYKKEHDGKAPPQVMIRLRNRWRQFQKGTFSGNVIVFRHPDDCGDKRQ